MMDTERALFSSVCAPAHLLTQISSTRSENPVHACAATAAPEKSGRDLGF